MLDFNVIDALVCTAPRGGKHSSLLQIVKDC